MSKMNFDLFSFLAGLAAGLLIWGIQNLAKSTLKRIIRYFSQWIQKYKERSGNIIEDKILENTFHRAQNCHIACSIFRLDQVVVPPKIFPPTKNTLNHKNTPLSSPTDQLFPFTPGFTELASQFPASRISLLEVIGNGANCVLVGEAGSGKTIALAHLVSQICRNRENHHSYQKLFPIYLHAHDIKIPDAEYNPIDLLSESLGLQNQSIKTPQIQRYLNQLLSMNERTILVALDGLDELLPDETDNYITLIERLQQQFPKIQWLTTANPEYLGKFSALVFTPLALCAWSELEVNQLISNWKTNWDQLQLEKEDQHYPIEDQYLLITNWLQREKLFLTPLEWTLLTWAGFAGDSIGPTPMHALEVYITRVIGKTIPRFAIENLAGSYIQNRKTSYLLDEIGKILIRNRPQNIQDDRLEFLMQDLEKTNQKSKNKPKKQKRISTKGQALEQLLDSGIIAIYNYDRVAFRNPVFLGYLASFDDALSEYSLPPSDLQWSGLNSTFRYLAAQNKHTDDLLSYTETTKPPLFTELYLLGRYLNTTREYSWRNKIFEKIGYLLAISDLPKFQLFQLTSILLSSNDPSIQLLFKQLLNSPKPNTRIIAALAVSALGMENCLKNLVGLLEDNCAEVRLSAALAISKFSNPFASQIIDEIMKNADEEQRIVTAESLALSKGSFDKLNAYLNSSDMLTRRAALAGLSKIDSDEAHHLLEDVFQNDSQWVIRSLAGEMLEAAQSTVNPHAPEIIPSPGESAWLIEYASQMGEGISPDIFPLDVLVNVAQNGNEEQQKGAMEYLEQIQDPEIENLYEVLFNSSEPHIREAAAYQLWRYDKTINKSLHPNI